MRSRSPLNGYSGMRVERAYKKRNGHNQKSASVHINLNLAMKNRNTTANAERWWWCWWYEFSLKRFSMGGFLCAACHWCWLITAMAMCCTHHVYFLAKIYPTCQLFSKLSHTHTIQMTLWHQNHFQLYFPYSRWFFFFALYLRAFNLSHAERRTKTRLSTMQGIF